MSIMDILLLLKLLNLLIVAKFSYWKTCGKTHGLLQRILRNRDIAVLVLMSMIFKISFSISPINFMAFWSYIIDSSHKA